MKKFNEHGRSMIEMLGVLAIIGVLSAGGLAGYAKAMFRHRLNTTIDQISMLVTNIRTTYGTQADYAGLVENAFDLNLIPTSLGTTNRGSASSALTLQSAFKGKLILTTGSTHGENDDGPYKDSAFIIRMDSLPWEACVALATADFGIGSGSGFIGVSVETGDGDDDVAVDEITIDQGYDTRGVGKVYDVTHAIDACKGQEDNSTVAWKFY